MAAVQSISMQYNEMMEGTTETTISAATVATPNGWEADISAGDTLAGEADALLEGAPQASVPTPALNTLTEVADTQAGHTADTLIEGTPAPEEDTAQVDKLAGEIAKDDIQQFTFKKPSLQQTPLPPPLTVDEFSREQLFQRLKNEHNEKLAEAFNKFSRP
uniref:Uncharacterized protein n=1 Tax=Glossina austeni TaxID=7395 RepID=A0A1A9VXB0_GLOAU